MKLEIQMILRIGFGWINLDLVEIDREGILGSDKDRECDKCGGESFPDKTHAKRNYFGAGKPASSRATSASADQSISPRPLAILESSRPRSIAATGIGARTSPPVFSTSSTPLSPSGKRNPAGVWRICAIAFPYPW